MVLMLKEHFFDMIIEKKALQLRDAHVLCPSNPLPATSRTAVAIERLGHVPFGTRVEKGQFIAFFQPFDPAIWGSTGSNANLDYRHVFDDLDMKLYTGLAGVVYEEEVAVEIDVLRARYLDSRICFLGEGQGWHIDASQQSAGWESDKRAAQRCKIPWLIDNFEDLRV